MPEHHVEQYDLKKFMTLFAERFGGFISNKDFRVASLLEIVG